MARALKSTIERIFETGKIYRFTDADSEILVAYQVDQRGCHRLALVDGDGNVVAPGCSSVYQHPTFATFGIYQFMAVTDFFDGEPVLPETVYRLEHGSYAGSGESVEIKERAEKKLEAVADEKLKEPGPWYIHKSMAESYGTDLIKLEVSVHHADGKQTRDLEETLNPEIGDIESVKVEEYCGDGYTQQSLVLIVEGEGGQETNIQVEVDSDTGEFDEDSLHGWEKI